MGNALFDLGSRTRSCVEDIDGHALRKLPRSTRHTR
jgi:hypothetical protein